MIEAPALSAARPRRGRRVGEGAAVIVLLGTLLADLWLGARPPRLAPTHDELANIPSGVAHLRLGRPSDFTHPPLSRYLTALPLLALGVDPVDTPEGRAALDAWKWKDYGRLFVFHNTALSAETIVAAARAPVMIMTAVLGFVVWLVVRRRAGSRAALLLLAAFSLSPTILAHGRLCTTDMPAALSVLLAALAFARSLRLRSVRSEVLAGVALGLALLVKYTAVTLLPAGLGLLLLARARERAGGRPAPWRRMVWRPVAIGALAAALTVWAGFGFQVRRIADEPLLRSNPKAQAIAVNVDRRLAPYGLRAETLMRLPIPAYDFWKGFGTQVAHNFLQDQWMHDSYQYLHGRYSQRGFASYFPLAFLWKTELPLLAALAAALAAAAWSLARRVRAPGGLRAAFAQVDVETMVLVVVPAVYALFCLTSTINIGHRYLLPIYPFLFVALGGLVRAPFLSTRPSRVTIAALFVWLAITSLRAFPDHLAYFNELVGGPREGWRYLADSNVDWGQDLWRLRDRLDLAGRPAPLYLDVFTSARPSEDLRLPDGYPLGPDTETGRPAPFTGLVVMSANKLLFKAPAEERPRHEWLIDAEPFARVGNSIFCYWIDRGLVRPPPPGSPAAALVRAP